MKVESAIKSIGYPQEAVYAKVSDLKNLEAIKDKLNDPDAQARLKANVNDDNMEKVRKSLETIQFDTDSVSMEVKPIGNITIAVIERESPKMVKFASKQSPISFSLWVQVLPVTDDTCKMKITVDASVNPFIGGMISKPLKEAVEKLADMLEALPYE